MILEPGGPAYRATKRAIDIVVAGLLLFLLAPQRGAREERDLEPAAVDGPLRPGRKSCRPVCHSV